MEDRGILSLVFAGILLFLVFVIGWDYKKKLNGQDSTNNVNLTEGVQLTIIDENENSLIGNLLHFVNTDDITKFARFHKPLYFEPGATYRTEGFQLRNDGVAVKFLISVNDDDTKDKEAFRSAFEFWIVSENNALHEQLTSFQGTLQHDEKSDTYYLVVKMKETASNEFQNKSFEGIGITVHAVQSLD